jgi:hypothetical protein
LTTGIRTAFNLRSFDEWGTRILADLMRLSEADIPTASPRHRVIYEVASERDQALVAKVYSNSKLVADVLAFGREYDTSTDSGRFTAAKKLIGKLQPVPHGQAEVADDHGRRWCPVVQGRSVQQFRFPHQSFDVATRKWHRYEPGKGFSPKFWMEAESYATSSKRTAGPKIAFRRTTQVMINPRSFIGAVIPDVPTADSLFLLHRKGPVSDFQKLLVALNSYVFDYVVRFRLPGINLSWYIVEESPLPFSWADLPSQADLGTAGSDSAVAAVREDLDAAAARAYGLTDDDMRWILRPDNPDPRNLWRDYRERLKVLEAAGHQGKWYTLEEARRSRRETGMGVDF